MISACVVPTVMHGKGDVMCFAGDTVCDLFRIQGTLNQHGYHSILHPIWFGLSGTINCFLTGQWPNTPPGWVRAIWPRRVVGCCIRWPGFHNRTAELRKSSQQVLSICRNSFKPVEKSFQVKLVERMPRVCKAVIKAKGGYFEESKI